MSGDTTMYVLAVALVPVSQEAELRRDRIERLGRILDQCDAKYATYFVDRADQPDPDTVTRLAREGAEKINAQCDRARRENGEPAGGQ